MNRNEFTQALRHLAHSPQHIVFFEEDLKQFALSMDQDVFFTNYWDVNRFIVACYDAAEQQGLFAQASCIYDEIRSEVK